MNNEKVIVYADLNCPFCFALHERLIASHYIDEVDWRCIEHAPFIKFDVNDYLVQSELSEEVTKVRSLADEVTIMIPRARPNTGLATKIIIETSKTDPERAVKLRTLFYRELWINGNDISDPFVINTLIYKAEAENRDISDESIKQLESWQQEWEEGDFSRNIPVVISTEGNKLLGLPSLSVLNAFFEGQSKYLADDYDGICQSSSSDKILVSTASDHLYKKMESMLGDEFEVSHVSTKPALQSLCANNEGLDLIILIESFGEDSCLDLIQLIRAANSLQNVPVILISLTTDLQLEIQAFEKGVNDFVVTPYADEALLSRIRLQLRLKHTVDLLAQHARIDSLTEIPNRREFNHVMEKEWRQAVRSNYFISVVLIDIDHFKAYNDSYGHLQGDVCLKTVAKLLEQCVGRPNDVIARYGGEEFVAVLPETDSNGAFEIANKIQAALASQKILNQASETGYLTVSQGIASVTPSTSSQLNELVKKADEALYDAKNSGRNCVKIHSDK